MRFIITFMLAFVTTMSTGRAHEIRPAIADVIISATEVEMVLQMTLEPVVAGMSLRGLANTNDDPLSDQYDVLRNLGPAQLRAAFDEIWPSVQSRIFLRAGETVLTPQLVSVDIPSVGDTELPRDSRLTLRADLPDDGTPVFAGWDASLGTLALRHEANGKRYGAILQDGALSEALPRDGGVDQSAMDVFGQYLVSGFDHIIPKGLDHILFVLGLFFFALAWGPLLWQVSAFTLAHTITLALATLGLVTISPAIVEPLIAASIAYVALENIFGKGRITPWRVGMIFGFGLLHGLGFASVLGDFGLSQGNFILSLIAFNIGVELGQIAVLIIAYLLIGLPFGKKPWYRARIQIPASIGIALVGLYWAAERTFL